MTARLGVDEIRAVIDRAHKANELLDRDFLHIP